MSSVGTASSRKDVSRKSVALLIVCARLRCDQLHTAAAVCFNKQHTADYCWAPEEVWTICRTQRFTAHTGTGGKYRRFSCRTVITVPTELSGTARAFLSCIECDNYVIASLSE
jgi:hypothetical protein